MEKSWKIGGMLLPKCYPWFVFLFCWREWDLLTQSWLLEIAENGAGAVVYNRLGSCLARIWPWLDPQHPMWSPKPAGMIPVHRDKSKSWALLVWPKNTTNKTEIAEITWTLSMGALRKSWSQVQTPGVPVCLGPSFYGHLCRKPFPATPQLVVGEHYIKGYHPATLQSVKRKRTIDRDCILWWVCMWAMQYMRFIEE